jgi:hypothetical protein
MAAANTHGACSEIRGATSPSRKVGEGFDLVKAVFKILTSATRWIAALGRWCASTIHEKRGRPGIRGARLQVALKPRCAACAARTNNDALD